MKINILKSILTVFMVTMILTPLSVLAAGISINYPGYPGPIFDAANIKPGDTYTKTVTVTNENSVTEKLGIKISLSKTGILADAIRLTIKDATTNEVKENRTLAGYNSAGEIQIGTIAPSESRDYIFSANFDSSYGDDYQGKSETFDISYGFIGTPANPGIPLGTIGIPLTRLSTTVAGFLGITSPGQTTVTSPEVKGEVKGNNEDQGLGQQGSNAKACPWWYAVLLILTLILFGTWIYFYKLKADNHYPRAWFIWPILAGVLAWFLHRYLQNGYHPTWFCNWFWALITIELIIYFSFYYFTIRKKDTPEDK